MRMTSLRRALASIVLLAAAVGPARAEVSTARIAQQPGLTYLPLVVMQHDKLVEKNAEAAGLGKVAVEWSKFAGGNVMNDALLSGNLDFAATGMPSFLILWDKGKGLLDVKGLCSYGSTPLYLVTRNPEVKTVRDFSEKDRIAVPAVKSSVQAILLEMQAEKEWGVGQHAKLDGLTISRAHPDAYTALVSGQSEITAHFAAPPYQQMALAQPGIHRVLSSEDVLGGPASNGVFYGTEKFRRENPRLIAVIKQSMGEAIDFINRDHRGAAEKYLAVTQEKTTPEKLVELIEQPGAIYTLAPQNTFAYASFMHRIGSIKRKAESWKDLYFPEAHDLPGS
jgi:NitT/TauT family transport system substrate-binding protein